MRVGSPPVLAALAFPAGGPGRHGLPARRPRLGPRGRHEPVGRRGLRAPRVRLQADPRALLPARRTSRSPTRAPSACCSAEEQDAVRDRLGRAVPRRRRAGASVAPAGARRRRGPKFMLRHKHLRQPLRFEPGAQPLTSTARGYRGDVVVKAKPAADGGQRAAARPLPARRRAVGGAEAGTSRRTRRRRWPRARTRSRRCTRTGLRPLPRRAPQMYGGIRAERPRRTSRSARRPGRCSSGATASIAAYYFSTSGGRTSSIHDAWPRAHQVPYLVSVSDPYDYLSPHHVWPTVTLPAAQVARVLGRSRRARRRSSTQLVGPCRRPCGC